MIKLDVDGKDYGLEVVDYSVQEEITPLAPGDSSGGVGSISVSAVARKDGPHPLRTSTILDRDIALIDNEEIEFTEFKGRGTVRGHVTKNTETGGRINLTADTLLSRLNTTRIAAPVFGVRKTGTRVTYRVNTITNPSSETGSTGYTAVAGTGGTVGLTRANTGGVAFSGTWYQRLAWTVAATGPGGLVYSQAVVPDTQQMFSAYTRLDGGGKTAQTIRMSVQYYTAGAVATGAEQFGVPVQINNATMTRASVFGVAPADAATVQIRLYNYDSGLPGLTWSNWSNGDVLFVDALMATQGPDLINYFDGSSANSSWQGTANASPSQQATFVTIDEGFDATIANAVRYYCGLVGIPQTSLIIDQVFEGVPVAYPAWEGNVWTYLKMLCVAVGAEMAVADNAILFRTPRKHTVQQENSDSFTPEVNAQATALNVEIYNYNNQWRVDSIVQSAESVISVTPGASSVTQITVPHSLTRVNNPLPTSVMADPETYVGPGQYLVTDANDVVVNPSTWTAMRGSVTAAMVPGSYDKIELTVVGPSGEGEYTAPFRIASATPFGDRPALYLTGEGVFTDRQVMSIATAASITQTSTETAPTIDNPFISTAGQAADRGVLAAMLASGPSVSISGEFSTDLAAIGADFDKVVGGRLPYRDNIYRIKTATLTSRSIEFTAEADVLFSDVVEEYSITFSEHNGLYTGMNFSAYNALWSPTATFASVMALSPQPSFDDINALYASMSFNDHAIYPLIPVPASTVELVPYVPPTDGYGVSNYGALPYGT